MADEEDKCIWIDQYFVRQTVVCTFQFLRFYAGCDI